MVSDITYIVTETFAQLRLFVAALVIIVVTLVVPALAYFFSGYKICTRKNLNWRWKTGCHFASVVWAVCLPESQRVVLAVFTLGIYPALVGIVCLLATTLPFLPLPVEILWQPLRLTIVVSTGKSILASFGQL